MARAFILVLDSLGIGSAPDAGKYGDEGANTLLHIAESCAAGRADNARRRGALLIPNLCRLGLDKALALACGRGLPGAPERGAAAAAHKAGHEPVLSGAYAVGQEISAGKDTPSGHWEMMGLPLLQAWGSFPPPRPGDPAFAEGSVFPRALLEKIYQQAGLAGSLGNCIASGTEIIARLGAEHCAGGRPIFYTSADSVFQVAAHEEVFGLARLYDLCALIRREVDSYNIGRVIARPFTGNAGQGFKRSPNRRDWTTPPAEPTLFDYVQKSGGTTIAIGKIADIFAHQGIDTAIKAYGTSELFAATLRQAREAPDNSLTMTNFVDFDQNFGHRRDIAGYAAELELFDRLLPQIFPLLKPEDLLVITADHGCDPSWSGSDHTREYVPQLFYGAFVRPVACGRRQGFADMGQTVASWLKVGPLRHGRSYYNSIYNTMPGNSPAIG